MFGVRGEVKCDATDAGRTAISTGRRFHFRGPLHSGEVEVKTLREHRGRLLATFAGFDDATTASRLAGGALYASRDQIELGDAEYFDRDLVGCGVVTPRGETIGIVSAVQHLPSSDMLIVNDRMLPLVDPFIAEIDVAARTIRVRELPPGLLDDA
jgi:16S rRNA processing protein RimM